MKESRDKKARESNPLWNREDQKIHQQMRTNQREQRRVQAQLSRLLHRQPGQTLGDAMFAEVLDVDQSQPPEEAEDDDALDEDDKNDKDKEENDEGEEQFEEEEVNDEDEERFDEENDDGKDEVQKYREDAAAKRFCQNYWEQKKQR